MKEIVNTADISTLLKCDPVFETIHTLYGPPPNWNRPEGFISLSRIILEQQVSLQSAKAHFNKLNSFLPAFTPGEIVKLSDEEMRLCQISRQKSIYLRALSSAILERKIELEKLSELPWMKSDTNSKDSKELVIGQRIFIWCSVYRQKIFSRQEILQLSIR